LLIFFEKMILKRKKMNNIGISFSPDGSQSFIEKLKQFTHTNSLECEDGVPVIFSHCEPVSQKVSNRAVKVLLRCFKEQISQELILQSISALSHLSRHYQSYEECQAAEKLNRGISSILEACRLKLRLDCENSDARSLDTKNEQRILELFQLTRQDGNKRALQQLAYSHLVENEGDHAKKTFECLSPESILDMVYTGNRYLKGEGVNIDEYKAFEYFKQAAEAGDVEAQNSLANLYLEGRGVAKDEKKAFENYKLAAAQNHRQALFNLAVSYERGTGTEINELEAIRCYEHAAELNDMEAQYVLGRRFTRGLGVRINLQTAFHYYKSAARADHTVAQFYLAECFKSGSGVKKNMKKAVKFYAYAAANGNHDAQISLFRCYFFGEGVPKDGRKAIDLLAKFASEGNPLAQCHLARFYLRGDYIGQDRGKAMSLLAQASRQGDTEAQEILEALRNASNA
jgi:TPR repeat protein